MQPAWLADTLAVLMLATAAYCSGRIVVSVATGRTTHRDVDVAHVLMGVAMAGGLVVALRTLPNGVWEVVFTGLGVWFAAEVVRFVRRHGWRGWSIDECHHISHYASHFVMSAAMLYMFGAGGGMTAGGAMPSGGLSTSGLPLLLVLLLMVAAVWYADSLARFSRRTVEPAPVLVAAGQPASGARAGEPPAVPGRPVHGSCDGRWLAPRQQVAAHMLMCVVMAYMLVLMQ